MEIVTRVERRRCLRVEENLRTVAETEQPGACFVEVARRHEVCRSVLWNWRRQVRRGTLRAEPQPAIVRVRLTNDFAGVDPLAHSAPKLSRDAAPAIDARIEITLTDGTAIRTSADVSLPALRRAMAALRGYRAALRACRGAAAHWRTRTDAATSGQRAHAAVGGSCLVGGRCD
jgi:transposase